MKKRTFNLILLVIATFSSYSCMLFIPKVKYEPEVLYEQKIIDTVETISSTNVAVVNKGSSKSFGSGVIIHKKNNNFDNTYYAITTYDVLNKTGNTAVYTEKGSQESVTNYAYNEAYNIAIIVFNSKTNLNVAKVFKNNKPFDVFEGQTIVSKGSESGLNYTNTAKQGIVSNTNVDYNNKDIYFTHDASNNVGEEGSGVYNLEGFLVGINMEKYHNENREKLLGINYALKIKEIDKLFSNLSNINFSSRLIPNNYLTSSGTVEQYSKDNYEEKINSVYLNNINSVVEVNVGTDTYSGIIIEKLLNTYKVLTVNIDDNIYKTIKTNSSTYNVATIESTLDNKLSILTFNTTDDLDVYNLNTDVDSLVRGQTLVTIGTVNSSLKHSLNAGTLSKPDSEYDNVFMHSTKANLSQKGSPIFNLNGNLVGIHYDKIDEIETSNGFLVAEGLSFAVKIEDFIEEYYGTKNINNYTSTNEYEEQVINVTSSVLNKTVTVKSDNSHGSGVIFKKENYNGHYLYSVLTNEHVVTNYSNGTPQVSDSLRIVFNNGMNPIRVKDYYYNSSHDMAIVRFESSENLEVVNSEVLDKEEKKEFVSGQIVIAVGTPEDSRRSGYVTTGVITRPIYNYENISELGLIHTAPLNPGNSGGPLFDLKGNLIGLNVAKGTNIQSIEGSIFSEGIGITLSINKISEVYNSKITTVKFTNMPTRTPRLGITVTPLNGPNGFKDTYPSYEDLLHDNATTGIVIVDVDELFDVYGKLELFDVIININGVPITANEDVPPIIGGKPFGFKVTVTVLRKGVAEPLDVVVYLS